jgi:hypothetical protein
MVEWVFVVWILTASTDVEDAVRQERVFATETECQQANRAVTRTKGQQGVLWTACVSRPKA